MPLRTHLDLVLPSWNRLIKTGTLTQNGVTVPAKPITSADMQGTKALYGKASASNPVWCKWKEFGDTHHQHAYPKEKVSSYAELCQVCDDAGCEILTSDEKMVSAAFLKHTQSAPFVCDRSSVGTIQYCLFRVRVHCWGETSWQIYTRLGPFWHKRHFELGARHSSMLYTMVKRTLKAFAS